MDNDSSLLGSSNVGDPSLSFESDEELSNEFKKKDEEEEEVEEEEEEEETVSKKDYDALEKELIKTDQTIFNIRSEMRREKNQMKEDLETEMKKMKSDSEKIIQELKLKNEKANNDKLEQTLRLNDKTVTIENLDKEVFRCQEINKNAMEQISKKDEIIISLEKKLQSFQKHKEEMEERFQGIDEESIINLKKEIEDLKIEFDRKSVQLKREQEWSKRLQKEKDQVSEGLDEFLLRIKLPITILTPMTPMMNQAFSKYLRVSDGRDFGKIKLESNSFSPYYFWNGGLICYIPFKLRIQTTKPIGSWKYLSELVTGEEESSEREIRMSIKPRFVSQEYSVSISEIKIGFRRNDFSSNNQQQQHNINPNSPILRTQPSRIKEVIIKKDTDNEKIFFTNKDRDWCEFLVRSIDINNINFKIGLTLKISKFL